MNPALPTTPGRRNLSSIAQLRRTTAMVVIALVYAWLWKVSAHRVFEAPSFAGFANVFQTGCGDFEHFFLAARAMRDGEDIYRAGAQGYIYPPLIAFLYMPLTFLTVQSAAQLMLLLNMAVALACTWGASSEACRRLTQTRSGGDVLVVMALATLLAATRLRSELQMWQTNLLMMGGVLLALKQLDSRPWLAGLALGFAINIKYLPLIFIPYLLLRRRWAAAAWSLAGFVAFALLPAVYTGLEADARAWATALSGLARLFGFAAPLAAAANIDPITAGYSLSVTSTIARIAGAGVPLWQVWLGTTAVALLIALIVATLYRVQSRPLLGWPAAQGQTAQPLRGLIQIEWAVLVIVALAFSPQTNPRHASLLVLVFAPLSAMICHPHAGIERRAAIAGAAVLFVAFFNPLSVPLLAPLAQAWNGVGVPAWGMLATIPLLYLAWTERA
jgi:hypothetical protein